MYPHAPARRAAKAFAGSAATPIAITGRPASTALRITSPNGCIELSTSTTLASPLPISEKAATGSSAVPATSTPCFDRE